MWSATDMGGSGPGREVTRGTTKATLWTSSEWELSQDLGKLSEASLADVDAALNPGEIYREPKDTHDTATDTKPPPPKTAEPEETSMEEGAEAMANKQYEAKWHYYLPLAREKGMITTTEEKEDGNHEETQNKVGIICRCASAHELDPIGYEKVTQRINRPRSSTMMGTLTFSAITLIAPTAEALNQQANMTTTATETMTAYLPAILTMIAVTAITAIIIAAAATKEAGHEKQTNVPKQKKPSNKKKGRSRSATPNRMSIGDLKQKSQNEMDEAHADGRANLETTLARTWEEIRQSAWQRFKGFEDQALTNFNEKTKVEAKGFKAFYERMEEMEDADSRSHLPTDDNCPWNKQKKGIICRCASAYEVDPHLDTKKSQKKSTGQALRS
jgi:hypothetical protein